MAEPITLALAKKHLRVDHSEEDDLIGGMIADARAWVEEYTGQTLVQAPLTEQINGFEAQLLAWPIASVTGVTYLDADGAEQELTDDVWELRNAKRPAALRLKSGAQWPTVRHGNGAITVELTAGYATLDEIPGGIRRAMYVLLEGYYSRDAKALAEAIATAKRSCGPKSRGWRLPCR
ncbi:head-tail connector protein [Rhizorhabdus sp.]|uniref:head-tail connector protein n=1 Tax=Rhizorhabdus sp. TaxID=1968843 RepID=UPI0019BC9D11|nr:head-tail connector protein [Rhizorhabdus sp.]MBD3762462.1 phage head-tail connector protein [Rhizorhabdus sp.]